MGEGGPGFFSKNFIASSHAILIAKLQERLRPIFQPEKQAERGEVTHLDTHNS